MNNTLSVAYRFLDYKPHVGQTTRIVYVSDRDLSQADHLASEADKLELKKYFAQKLEDEQLAAHESDRRKIRVIGLAADSPAWNDKEAETAVNDPVFTWGYGAISMQ